jgi:uncharacterized protein
MKLRNEFVVAAPLERAWETLLDIERVANFLPGAVIEGSDADGAYAGTMRVKLGPMVIDYRGTARLGEVDEASHTASMMVQATDQKGQGGASAVIHNQLVEENGGTRVIAETDLQITGRQAQFGRGIMQDVASRMLGQFADRFEAYLLAGEAPAASAAGVPGGVGPGVAPAAGRAREAAPASAFESPAMWAVAAGLVVLTLVVGVVRRRQWREFEARSRG